MLEGYLEQDQVAEVYRAYLVGAEAHDGQTRMSGEPYIYHPVAVARSLAEMRLDYQTIIAAILHDVIEDTEISKEQLAEDFGEEVADLVDGVSKLTKVEFGSKAEAQAANFRKMMLAMTQDIRVILIKLADRLHNMRTLGVMRPDKRRRIAKETLEIYVPIANRLGINAWRQELEDLGLAARYPFRYAVIKNAVKNARGNRKELVQKIESSIIERLRQDGVEGEVSGREKHIYSLYRKMSEKGLSFNDVLDVYAFRVVVENVDACYRVVGVVHNLYKPVPGKFKDYIAIPKTNGYQSLHTILFGPHGVPVEVQIRTQDMEKVAEAGIAAHWRYKTGDGNQNGAQQRVRAWTQNLLEMQKSAGNSLEFLENVKIDLFPDEVYVFTPRGEIMELPRGATAVDYAYAVHSDVGSSCVAVKIDRRLSPLSTVLLNGQTVEIITAPNSRPNPSWLNFAITGKARSTIRHYLKNLQQHEAVALGERMLNKALYTFDKNLDDIDEQHKQQLLEEYQLQSFDEILADIGLGNRIAPIVARTLLPSDEQEEREPGQSRPLAIMGTEGMIVRYSRCCHPIPGDPIIGLLTRGRGIAIHTESCKNIADLRNQPEKQVDVQWAAELDADFGVDIRVEAENQRGVLATIAAELAEMSANIENVRIDERDGLTTSLHFTIMVKDRIHLARIIRRLRQLDPIIKINRR